MSSSYDGLQLATFEGNELSLRKSGFFYCLKYFMTAAKHSPSKSRNRGERSLALFNGFPMTSKRISIGKLLRLKYETNLVNADDAIWCLATSLRIGIIVFRMDSVNN